MNWYKRSQNTYWGKAGSGILFVCPEDGTALLMLRSDKVEQPNTWNIPGGAILNTDGWHSSIREEENFPDNVMWDSAVRETTEELSYFPSDYKRTGETTFHDESFFYKTYIVSVSLEEKRKIDEQAELNRESTNMKWFSFNNMRNISPEQMHFGLKNILEQIELDQ